MHRLFLSATLALWLSLPAAAEVVVTGNNGGTVAKTHDCTRGEGSAECATGTTYTSADGTTASKTRLRNRQGTTGETDVTLTGPEGKTKTRHRKVEVSN